MDLSDNDLKRLDGFPNLRRLKLLIVCNNHISRISPELATALPCLQRLVLINNNIRELADLLPITKMKSLKCLCLLRNPVTNHPHFRSFVIHHMPYLRILDCQKIMPLVFSKLTKEIDEAGRKFSGVEGLKLMKELIETQTRPRIKFDEEASQPNGVVDSPQKDERTDAIKVFLLFIKNAIKSAKTLDEVRQLETMLKSGTLPAVGSTS